MRITDLPQGEEDVIDDVVDELFRQYAKFGLQKHDPFVWTSIVGEELGEADEAALKANFEGADSEHYRKELVEVAASAIAAVACYDRQHQADTQSDD